MRSYRTLMSSVEHLEITKNTRLKNSAGCSSLLFPRTPWTPQPSTDSDPPNGLQASRHSEVQAFPAAALEGCMFQKKRKEVQAWGFSLSPMVPEPLSTATQLSQKISGRRTFDLSTSLNFLPHKGSESPHKGFFNKPYEVRKVQYKMLKWCSKFNDSSTY